MDKDLLQLSEEQLKEVSGGAFDSNELMEISDIEKAKAYLIKCGAQPGMGFYEAYLAAWEKMHG